MNFFKKKATKQSWKRVLMEIYNHAPNWYTMEISKKHPLLKKLKIKNSELKESAEFLKMNKLTNKVLTDKGVCFGLTEKGFDIALRLEKSTTEYSNQFVLMIVTLLLAIVATWNFYASFVGYQGWVLLSFIGILIAMMIAIQIGIKKIDKFRY